MSYSLAFQAAGLIDFDQPGRADFALLLPELIVAVAAVVVMVADALTRRLGRRWLTGGLSLAGLGAAAVACFWLWERAGGSAPRTAFGGMIELDRFRLSFTLVFLLVAAITVLLSMIWVEWERLPAGEFHTLLLFATSGMMLMASGGDLVVLFLGFEVFSIATYVMAGFRKTDLRSNESSMKYFILGSFSSAFLLYGIALVYGATATSSGGTLVAGTTNIREIALRLDDAAYPALLYAGAAMMLVGFAFKIGSAPFHVWTPDVYEGAPPPVTAFMAAGPKAAGFAGFMRVFLFAFPFVGPAAALTQTARLHEAWLGALWILAVLTMTLGNVVALVQKNVKRMLAYSSVAHAGYALVGLLAGDWGAVAFYMLAYAFMNVGAFAVVATIARRADRATTLEDYRGIGFDNMELSVALSVFM
ncbi:MAG TPA: NADH-quinone oxidoreductase subunit N, partial [Pyrinomonadaceae bacterium]|nr:NADH-quinone oxidoreductase subunit N [Pyrinomonadaceae bacterium]